MDIRKVLSSFAMIAALTFNAWATPPSSLTLTYDVDKQMLHVSAVHASERLDKHYLRRIVVFKNNEEIDTVNLTRQKAPSGVEEDIPVETVGGEKLSVQIYCSKGGLGRGEVDVPVPSTEKEKNAGSKK